MADVREMRIFSADQIVVPEDLPQILKDFSKEVIRQNPNDVVQFSKEYFEMKHKVQQEELKAKAATGPPPVTKWPQLQKIILKKLTQHVSILNFNNYTLFSQLIILFVGYLPNLDHIIIGSWRHHQFFIMIPWKISYSVSVTAMHKQKLWWPISLLLLCLWLVEPAEVPDHGPAIMTAGSQKVALHLREPHIVHVFGVRSETKELGFDVSHVPNGHSSVCWSSDHQELVKGRAIDTHDLLDMTLDGGSGALWVSGIPNFQLFVITHGREDVLVKVIPGHVLNDWAVSGVKWKKWFLSDLVGVGGVDVPYTGLAVVRSREQETFFYGVPREPIALLAVTDEAQIWLYLVVNRSFRVLKVVKNVNLSICSFGCNNFLILRHVSSFIDFTLVVNLDIDRDSSLLGVGDTGAANSIGVVIQNILLIVPCVFRWF
jgi:hypothetical protein